MKKILLLILGVMHAPGGFGAFFAPIGREMQDVHVSQEADIESKLKDVQAEMQNAQLACEAMQSKMKDLEAAIENSKNQEKNQEFNFHASFFNAPFPTDEGYNDWITSRENMFYDQLCEFDKQLDATCIDNYMDLKKKFEDRDKLSVREKKALFFQMKQDWYELNKLECRFWDFIELLEVADKMTTSSENYIRANVFSTIFSELGYCIPFYIAKEKRSKKCDEVRKKQSSLFQCNHSGIRAIISLEGELRRLGSFRQEVREELLQAEQI